MPCYHPQKAYKDRDGNVTFVRKDAITNLSLPCGGCIGCKLERSRQWAVRIMHEAQLHDENIMITLTYDDEYLPIDESINVKHFQKFMKALRHKYAPKKIRFYHCGEYGEENRRPHYHAILFNHDFQDKEIWKQDNEIKTYTSKTLSSIWHNGFTSISDVTLESAQYVAKYIIKKINGAYAPDHYSHMTRYGEITQLTPEYTTMSRRPGIASNWYQQYKTDVFPSNFITFNGKKMSAPKYYQKILEQESPRKYEKLKRRLRLIAKQRLRDNTPPRLHAREQCAQARLTKRNQL